MTGYNLYGRSHDNSTLDIKILDLINVRVSKKFCMESLTMEAMFPAEMARRKDLLRRVGKFTDKLKSPHIGENDPLRALIFLAHSAIINIDDVSKRARTEIKRFLEGFITNQYFDKSVFCAGNIVVPSVTDEVSSNHGQLVVLSCFYLSVISVNIVK